MCNGLPWWLRPGVQSEPRGPHRERVPMPALPQADRRRTDHEEDEGAKASE